MSENILMNQSCKTIKRTLTKQSWKKVSNLVKVSEKKVGGEVKQKKVARRNYPTSAICFLDQVYGVVIDQRLG